MNADTFMQNFGHLANASGGVSKLREMTLQFAMMGQLVPQDDTDDPAACLIEQIECEWKRLISEKKARKGKTLPTVEANEFPFGLPDTWVWVRLGNIVDYQGPEKVSASEISDDAWLLDLADVEKDTSRIIQRSPFKERLSKSTKARFSGGGCAVW